MRPRLLDLCSGAGGAAVGYARAGFDVVGIDVAPQPHYPFAFIEADALDVLTAPAWRDFLDGFDAVHASPPCQVNSALSSLPHVRSAISAGRHIDLIPAVRDGLTRWHHRTGRPWVIENVPGADLRAPLVLCGTEFDLHADTAARGRVWLRRHRLFETSPDVFLMGAGGCHCNTRRGRIIGVYGHGDGGGRGWKGSFAGRATAMGIDWMTRDELAQAIPPAYTHHIGAQLLDHLTGQPRTHYRRTGEVSA